MLVTYVLFKLYTCIIEGYVVIRKEITIHAKMGKAPPRCI